MRPVSAHKDGFAHPTLDVTVQAQIMTLLKELQEESGMDPTLIVHDLSVCATSPTWQP